MKLYLGSLRPTSWLEVSTAGPYGAVRGSLVWLGGADLVALRASPTEQAAYLSSGLVTAGCSILGALAIGAFTAVRLHVIVAVPITLWALVFFVFLYRQSLRLGEVRQRSARFMRIAALGLALAFMAFLVSVAVETVALDRGYVVSEVVDRTAEDAGSGLSQWLPGFETNIRVLAIALWTFPLFLGISRPTSGPHNNIQHVIRILSERTAMKGQQS